METYHVVQDGDVTGTPQSEPIPGSAQSRNSAGGFTWDVDDWTRLHRFLILGVEGGSYTATEATLTAECAGAALRCLERDGDRAVELIAEISEAGRAPRNDPALFALALAASHGTEATRQATGRALPRVARTGTHLLHFAAFVDAQRGWGRGLRKAVAAWYNQQDPRALAYQLLKYGQRDGWSHRDLLRLAHPTAPTELHQALYQWVTRGWDGGADDSSLDPALEQVWGVERARRAAEVGEVVQLIREYRLPREAVPTRWLGQPGVWAALLEEMPLTALLRNLATLTRVGLLGKDSVSAERVAARLTDPVDLRAARVHPLAVLAALTTYGKGRGLRGRHTWTPVTQVVEALDAAFYASFGNIEPAGKRCVLALDVSSSMARGAVAGVSGLTPRVASAAMALVTAATETHCQIMAFCDRFVPMFITPDHRLDHVVRAMDEAPFGGTDCALPMLWALENRVEADAFIIYTDSETWYGEIHPAEALRRYREVTGIPARLVVVGMVGNRYSIADPTDSGMLDVVGFDTAAPALIGNFAAGRI